MNQLTQWPSTSCQENDGTSKNVQGDECFNVFSEDTGIASDDSEDIPCEKYGLQEECERLDASFSKLSDSIKNLFPDQAKFNEFTQFMSDKYSKLDLRFRKISIKRLKKDTMVYYTYFGVDTTLFEYCQQSLPDDDEKLFKLFKAWCVGIFYIGKGTKTRLCDHVSTGVHKLCIEVSLV